MSLIIYIAIFFTGLVFGSFFTLAVYRIPRKENIVYGRSHCTSCNHKLGFLDLIPVLSYIFLGGKCRYCKEKIRIRYLLLEVLSGIVFLAIALTRDISSSLVELCFIYLFISGMFIIAGIDKENLIIPNSVCIYELVIAILYLIYNILIKNSIIDNIVGLIAIPIIFFIIDKAILLLDEDKKMNVPIGYGDIKYLSVIGLMFGFSFQILSIILSALIMLIGLIIHKYKEIPWGYYITISSSILIIFLPYLSDIIDLIRVWSWYKWSQIKALR